MLATKLLGASSTASVGYIASAKAQTTSTSTTITIDKPTGTVENHLMLAIVCTDSGTVTWTHPSGWTEVLDQGAQPSLSIAYKVAGASEGANYTFTSSANRRLGGAILTFSSAAYDAVGTISTTTTGGVQTAPAITLSSNNSAIVACFFRSVPSTTWSSPSAGLVSAETDSDITQPSFAIYYQTDLSSGSTGTRVATPSNSTGIFACVLLGLKPP